MRGQDSQESGRINTKSAVNAGNARETRANSIQNKFEALIKRAFETANRQDNFLERMRGSVPVACTGKEAAAPANSHLNIMEQNLDALSEAIDRFLLITDELENIA